MTDVSSTAAVAPPSTGIVRLRRILASLLAVLATVYLGILLGRYLALFVVDCTIESISHIPIKWGLTAVGVSYIFASLEKVLKLAFTFRDYILKPDKKVALYPDCIALALIVAYLTLLTVAFAHAKDCDKVDKNPDPLPSRDVVYLTRTTSTNVKPLEWVPFFFVELASERKPEQGTTLTRQQEADLARLLESLRACVGDAQGKDVELGVRGYADTNEFPASSTELNRRAANRRAENLHKKVAELLGDQAGLSRVILNMSHEWPADDPNAMTKDRYFETRPLVQTGKARDQGLFNRRADLLILKLGECDRMRAN